MAVARKINKAHARAKVTPVSLAISILDESFRELPLVDRADIFKLLNLLRKETDEDERQNIVSTIEEILSQKEYASTPLDMAEQPEDEPGKFAKFCAEKIKKIRVAAGWSQTELAEKSGIPQSYISRIESAQHTPTHKTLKKLAAAFGVDLGQLDPSF